MFCTKCGSQIAPGNKFCTVCGNPVRVNAANVQERIRILNEPDMILDESPDAAYTPAETEPKYLPRSPKKHLSKDKKAVIIISVILALIIGLGVTGFIFVENSPAKEAVVLLKKGKDDRAKKLYKREIKNNRLMELIFEKLLLKEADSKLKKNADGEKDYLKALKLLEPALAFADNDALQDAFDRYFDAYIEQLDCNTNEILADDPYKALEMLRDALLEFPDNEKLKALQKQVFEKSPEFNKPVTFHDSTFEAAFRNKYGYSADEVITKGTVLSYTELELPGCGLTDITDAAMFENLTKLNLGYYYEDDIGIDFWPYNNQISDISPLAGLTNLTELDLSYQADEEWNSILSNISPLAGLTNLTELNLWGNQITDITSLSRLTNLTELDLGGNKISDTSPLSGFKNLTKLDLGDNVISDVSPLSGLTKLTELDLGWNKISDITPLVGLKKLAVLDLTFQRYYDNGKFIYTLSDISPLSELINLTKLDLADNKISDISPLLGLKNLNELGLWENQIFDINPLSGLTNLMLLDLSWQCYYDENDEKVYTLSDINPLSGLTKLTELVLYGNKITDISPLSGLTNLTGLDLRDNNLTASTDVTPLFSLIKLEWLEIKNGNELTRAQLDAIHEHLPNCNIS